MNHPEYTILRGKEVANASKSIDIEPILSQFVNETAALRKQEDSRKEQQQYAFSVVEDAIQHHRACIAMAAGNTIIGTTFCIPTPLKKPCEDYDVYEIRYLYVDPVARGKGISQTLVHNAIEEIITSHSIASIMLTTSHKKIQNIALAWAFTPIGMECNAEYWRTTDHHGKNRTPAETQSLEQSGWNSYMLHFRKPDTE